MIIFTHPGPVSHNFKNDFKIALCRYFVRHGFHRADIAAALSPVFQFLQHLIGVTAQILKHTDIDTANLIKNIKAFAVRQFVVKDNPKLLLTIAAHGQQNPKPEKADHHRACNLWTVIKPDLSVHAELLFDPRELHERHFILHRNTVPKLPVPAHALQGILPETPKRQSDPYETGRTKQQIHDVSRHKIHLPDIVCLYITVPDRKLNTNISERKDVQNTYDAQQLISKLWIAPGNPNPCCFPEQFCNGSGHYGNENCKKQLTTPAHLISSSASLYLLLKVRPHTDDRQKQPYRPAQKISRSHLR